MEKGEKGFGLLLSAEAAARVAQKADAWPAQIFCRESWSRDRCGRKTAAPYRGRTPADCRRSRGGRALVGHGPKRAVPETRQRFRALLAQRPEPLLLSIVLPAGRHPFAHLVGKRGNAHDFALLAAGLVGKGVKLLLSGAAVGGGGSGKVALLMGAVGRSN